VREVVKDTDRKEAVMDDNTRVEPQEPRDTFVEPDIVKHDETVADVTAIASPGADGIAC
jgi:hypothetical protein